MIIVINNYEEKPDLGAHVYNPSYQEDKREGSWVSCKMGYMEICLNKQVNKM